MTEIREFHIGDILSVTTGFLLSDRGIEAMYDLLQYMTGEPLWTHQLPRACDECAPEIRRQHPTIGAIKFPKRLHGDGPLSALAWVRSVAERFGEFHPVTPLKPGDHTSIDPVSELKMMVPEGKIIVVEVPDAD